jgi:tetratricopeptide (TPR) repeat protein
VRAVARRSPGAGLAVYGNQGGSHVFMIGRAVICSAASALLAISAAAQSGGMSTGGSSQRPIYVTGRVAVDDGLALPHKAKLELVCPPNAQAEGTTDSKGGFSVELGTNRFLAATDAGMSSPGAGTGFSGPFNTDNNRTQVDGMSIIALEGCFLRASLPGYLSDSYEMNRIRVGDVTTNVGTLFLHPIAKTVQTSVSATSLSAPKDVQKSLEKARDYVQQRQFAMAESELNNAVSIYPKYAEAWQELGGVLQAEKKNADARQAYLKAAASDSSFAQPYLSLALLAAQEKRWQEALAAAAALVKLNPKAYPQAYYYSAVAYYNLSNPDKALENARQAVELDTRHATPLAEELLGVLYYERGDYKAAAEQYRNCIEHMGDTAGVEAVKGLLAKAEDRASRGAPNTNKHE